MEKWVYLFGGSRTEGRAEMRELLGGKGANLAEMARLGLPVPPGCTITTAACAAFLASGGEVPPGLTEQLAEALKHIEAAKGGRFGDPGDPLLLSVRSGARESMPGMMDTVLNIGLNDETVEGLARRSGDRHFAFDSYRRLLQMYGEVVLGLPFESFDTLLTEARRRAGVSRDSELDEEALARLCGSFKATILEGSGRPFPEDPRAQLLGAVEAVFRSWMGRRAVEYRRIHGIPDAWGTAVNVQAMVFGNLGSDSATGVCFTRNPATGAPGIYGEYLPRAQGEDVVSGTRDAHKITRADREASGSSDPSLEEAFPEVFAQLVAIGRRLEAHDRDMQDIEFTIESGRLWILQTRRGKRTPQAALRIAVDLVEEGLLSRREALMRVAPEDLARLLHPVVAAGVERRVVGRGLPASPGAAPGQLVFTAADAAAWSAAGREVVLARPETSPEDVAGMNAARGLLTARGGMTSHAAVVARSMGTPCVAGAKDLHIDPAAKTLRAGELVLGEGDWITLDGHRGEVLLGRVATEDPQLGGAFDVFMGWADEERRLVVRANAETPSDAAKARLLGAQGIGLCRTEHMFFASERIVHVRRMILAGDDEARRSALDALLPMQRGDFIELFEIMAGLPVTIRLLDPPLHEFLPHDSEEMADLAEVLGTSVEEVAQRTEELREANPMLGHRGCRLAVTAPEIYAMQVRAIVEAAVHHVRSGRPPVHLEIMVPLVALRHELALVRTLIEETARAVLQEASTDLAFLVGTMIELPRAALRAGSIAEVADFFSFGTNDLTQTTFGLSRDDAGTFLPTYVEKGLMEVDPFVSLDQQGVGELVRLACEVGRRTRPDLHLGICGEHGGDPASIDFFHRTGLDYVSCSPYRVPVARLAAAQARLREEER